MFDILVGDIIYAARVSVDNFFYRNCVWMAYWQYYNSIITVYQVLSSNTIYNIYQLTLYIYFI